MIRSYKYRIYPNKAQEVAVSDMLADFCRLYNAALEQRISSFKETGNSPTFFQQSKELTKSRKLPVLARWSFTAEERVLRRLDHTYKAFFRRGHGFPRFRAVQRFNSAEFRLSDGLSIRDSGKVRLVGIPGEIKVTWSRDLPSKPKTGTISRRAGRWFIIFAVEVESEPLPDAPSVGIDLGLTSLVALSTGETVARSGWTKRAAKGLRRRQRALARCQMGSANRRKRKQALARFHFRIANRRRDEAHKLSRNLVNRFGAIAFENLNIKGLARTTLAKHIQDAAWRQLIELTTYKAESAGRVVKLVDPNGTSQTCPECGAIKKKALSERTHSCDCGCEMDRDVAAAIVVHQRAFPSISPGAGHEPSSGRSGAELGSEAA